MHDGSEVVGSKSLFSPTCSAFASATADTVYTARDIALSMSTLRA